jgi:transcription elongation factor
MRKVLLGLSAAAIAATGLASAGDAKTYVCTRWHNGVCVSTHRVKGTGTAPYATGYVFGPTYAYTPYSGLPQPVVTYYKLNNSDRYVYSNGYVYVVDPTTYAVTRVIDTFSH